jgi:hypothetical protein
MAFSPYYQLFPEKSASESASERVMNEQFMSSWLVLGA